MRHHYDTTSGFNEAIIALGSEKPVKEFIKLTLKNKGDIYFFDELLRDVDQTWLDHHLSLHQSGEIYNRSSGQTRERNQKRKPSIPLSCRPEVHELPRETTTLLEEFFYEGHKTVESEANNQKVVWCAYKMVIGSTLRWSIDLVNREEESIIDRVIRKRFPSDPQDGHAFSFAHQGRTVVVCMEFSGGTAVVDERKLRETDAKKLEHHRVLLCDSLKVK